MTLQDVLRMGEKELMAADIPEAKLNAWYLFAYYFVMDRSRYFLNQDMPVSGEDKERYQRLLELRKARIPLEYITHQTEFMGLPFYVDEHVLIPRQDTECLVEELLEEAGGHDVLDLCTGSGCIGISLAVLGHCRSLVLADYSEEALKVAERNARDNEVEAVLVHSDLFEDIRGSFDLIVSNPPYIPTGQIPSLMPEVREHEPHMALDGSADGLSFYRRIIEESRGFLRKEGILAFETGYDQGKDVARLMEQAGFLEVRIKQDLAGLDRIVRGKWR